MEKILHLTLKKKWFDMILAGHKWEEYREIKPYWDKRFIGRVYDIVRFKNGYGKDVPTIDLEWKGCHKGYGMQKHGAPVGKEVYVITLGRLMESSNIS